jgi:guanylate cyclase
MRQRLVSALEGVVADPAADADRALKKRLMVTTSVRLAALALLWGLVYVAFGEPLAGAIPITYGLLSFASLAVLAATGRFSVYQVSQLLLILLLPFLLQLALGGFVPGSAVIVWAFCAPVGALLVSTRRVASALLVTFGALVVLSLVLQPLLSASTSLPDAVVALFFALNLVGTAVVTYLAMQFFVQQKDRAYGLLEVEQARSERLLLNVLPAPIAGRLKVSERTIADRHDAVSVLFADIVGFTPLSSRMEAGALVGLLNAVFSDFDEMTRQRGLEKIRTIGDAYMVAAGVPTPRRDHAHALVELGFAMLGRAAVVESPGGAEPLALRVGISSGSAVAGVIGRTKFQYDLWGDTVNTASRMESHGVPGRIQISEPTYRLVADTFTCVPRGEIEVKGKGRMPTWLVLAPT